MEICGKLAFKHNCKIVLIYMKNLQSYSVFTDERIFLVDGVDVTKNV